jgi:alcohol/geraniol dehydrogenase (NADP+)
MTTVNAFAASEKSAELISFTYELGELGANEVEVAVESCGICHSDLSMLDNEWGITTYPFVPGHEIVGTIRKIGSAVTQRKVGERVGIGWYAESCMHCNQCMSGLHNLCTNNPAQTIVGRHGGFADVVRSHWAWAAPLPSELDHKSAGPLFCGGITVFSPIVESGVMPTDKVGVIGGGGLGHLAIKFLKAWGCDVTAFSSTPAKSQSLIDLGAHRVVSSTDTEELKKLSGTLDFIISTVNVKLEWEQYVHCLAPNGKLHFVGAVLEPVSIGVFSMLGGNKSIGASPLGSPDTLRKMLEFSARHSITPDVEYFSFKEVNKALSHLRDGKARYRVVLTH